MGRFDRFWKYIKIIILVVGVVVLYLVKWGNVSEEKLEYFFFICKLVNCY